MKPALRNVFLLLTLAIAVLAAAGADRVDINHASLAELKALPGVRDAWAAAIVRNRPYKNKAQLLSKQVIPEAAYARIRNRIVAKQ